MNFKLPRDILLIIFSQLSFENIKNLRLCSKSFNNLINQNIHNFEIPLHFQIIDIIPVDKNHCFSCKTNISFDILQAFPYKIITKPWVIEAIRICHSKNCLKYTRQISMRNSYKMLTKYRKFIYRKHPLWSTYHKADDLFKKNIGNPTRFSERQMYRFALQFLFHFLSINERKKSGIKVYIH
jgi:hypothetical protein